MHSGLLLAMNLAGAGGVTKQHGYQCESKVLFKTCHMIICDVLFRMLCLDIILSIKLVMSDLIAFQRRDRIAAELTGNRPMTKKIYFFVVLF